MRSKNEIPPDKHPPNVPQTKLSAIIGYSIKSINNWRQFFDDFPGPDQKTKLYNVAKVRQWLEDHPDVGEAGNKVSMGREALMCENLEKRNKLLDKQIGEAELRLVEIDRVLAALAVERNANIQAFRKRLLSELPAELEGKTARELAAGLESAFNEYLSDVQSSIPRIVKACRV